MQLIFYWFSWSTIARDWKYICYVWLSKGAIVHPLMLLNGNTYVNSIIESSFTVMKFTEVLMKVYLPYSFNCWRKWMYILRKWTAKGVWYNYCCIQKIEPERVWDHKDIWKFQTIHLLRIICNRYWVIMSSSKSA